MELFQINYELKNQRSDYTVGIVAKKKEKAIDKICRQVGAIRVNTMSAKGPVHVIDDEIIDGLISNSDKIKKFKKRINERNEIIKDYEVELADMKSHIEALQKRIDSHEQKPDISSKEIAKALKGKKQPAEKKVIYSCPHCTFETEKKKGIKLHITKMHKK